MKIIVLEGWILADYKKYLTFKKGCFRYSHITIPIIYKNKELGKFELNKLKKVSIIIKEEKG